MPTPTRRAPSPSNLALWLLLAAVVASFGLVRGGPDRPAASPAATGPSTSTTTAPPTTAGDAAAPEAASGSAPAPRVDAPPVTPAVAPVPTTAPAPPPPVWAGKGMWIYQPTAADQGDGYAIVDRARAEGISTVYVRTGSSHDGLTMDWVLDFLPIAHAGGLKVIGWDFPELDDVTTDVLRAVTAIRATAVDGSTLDGFAADIETTSEGTNLTVETVDEYGSLLRPNVPGFPLIACVPNPSPYVQGFYPYPSVTAAFDAIAPMVYWMNRDPAADVANAIAFLAPLGKPVVPVGQAFDSAVDGGTAGKPGIDQLSAFATSAAANGAAGVSFWSWQHADADIFSAIGTLPPVGLPH